MNEQEILKFWQEKKIFKKSLSKSQKLKIKNFVFYDGPPFATGLPHYGHILASIIKDVIPRYKTMRGFRVPRRWGWDCHGLPVENEVEKELGFQSKKDIEKFGVGKFNEKARSSVLRYADEWKKIVPRIGRWVDMDNDYKTMDSNYTESVWWVFKTLYDKGFVYKDYRVAPYCPRCGTPLSNFELNQPDAYRDIEDQSVYIRLKIKDLRFKDAYFLIWTTTPWTLPGNVALAVGPKIDYVKISYRGENLILAKERLSIIAGEYKILETYKGKDLVGLKYEPLYKIRNPKSEIRNFHRVVAADFVSVEDGTGIVHIAPAFGEEDMEVGKKEKLPTIITVDPEGKIIKGLGIPGEGLFVKKTDEEIKKDLRSRGLLFKEERIMHSYPHCWRCETPLLYYPVSSWYVAVRKIKKRLIKNNKKIRWVPSHIRDGRFGKWLEEVRDWDVARNRFWGAPIPVWRCQFDANQCGQNAEQRGKKSCDNKIIIGSLEELKRYIKKSGNRYFAMRHGEAESNAKNIVSSKIETAEKFPLTAKGKKQVLAAVKKLKKNKINIIFSSDFLRTRETAEMIAEQLGMEKSKIIFDKRLREIDTGIFDGKNPEEYRSFASLEEKFHKVPPEGENLNQLKNRVAEFLYEIENKYANKNILIVSHEYSIWLLFAGANGADAKKAIEMKKRIRMQDFIKTGEITNLDFVPLPHNQNYELDFHRPYIDEIEFPCVCGGIMKRTQEVFDCWFESGAMPYAQSHYPFAFAQNQKSKIPAQKQVLCGTGKNQKFEFPAEFIAEGIDQTRGWFYTLLVLSSALFNKPAFKNVIVNGTILAEDGRKMSKRLKNYPDPMELVHKYGADALRLYLLSSPAVKGENLNFSEKGVDEIYKKVILRLWNVFQFYELYADKRGSISRNARGSARNQCFFPKIRERSANVLDKWILTRLNNLIRDVLRAMEDYELDKAVRPLNEFVDDLSTWYVRRSRRRFQRSESKKDFFDASQILRFTLSEFSKLLAPFAPFIAEGIYKNFKLNESVHLAEWPKQDLRFKNKDLRILKDMSEIRKLASLALAKRAEAGIKVRQPLKELRIKNSELRIKDKGLLKILADEINVKEIIFDDKIKSGFELDTKITLQLREEGILRDFVRTVQGLRHEADYRPNDIIYLYVSAGDLDAVFNKNLGLLKKEVGAKIIEFKRTEKPASYTARCYTGFDAEKETQIDGQKIWIGIKKV